MKSMFAFSPTPSLATIFSRGRPVVSGRHSMTPSQTPSPSSSLKVGFPLLDTEGDVHAHIVGGPVGVAEGHANGQGVEFVLPKGLPAEQQRIPVK